jgi:3-dehydroquinate synthase
MAFSATLANQRQLLSDDEHRRLLNLFSRAGLSMDHELFNEDMLERGTRAIMKTRDGQLRAAVPNPIGSCTFLNDVTIQEMNAALRHHKEIMKVYPREGAGLDAYVDASDTGYTMNDTAVGKEISGSNMNGTINGKKKDSGAINGILDGLKEVMANGYPNGCKN